MAQDDKFLASLKEAGEYFAARNAPPPPLPVRNSMREEGAFAPPAADSAGDFWSRMFGGDTPAVAPEPAPAPKLPSTGTAFQFDSIAAPPPSRRLDAGPETARQLSPEKPKNLGVFGDSFGILSPEKSREDAQSRLDSAARDREQAEFEYKSLRRTKDRIASGDPLARFFNPEALNIQIASVEDRIFSAKKEEKENRERLDGKSPLATKTATRSAIEKAAGGFSDAVLSIPQFAGILKGYLGDHDVDDDTLVKWATDAKKYAADMFPGDEVRQNDFSQQLASGVGQLASFYGGGAIAQLAKMGPKGTALIVSLMGASASGSQGFDEATQKLKEAEEEARASGNAPALTEIDRIRQTMGYAGVGLTEAIPVAKTFSRAAPDAKGLARRARDGLEGGVEEFVQETGSQLATNAIARETTDPTRALSEGVSESGQVGGALGFLAGALMPGRQRASLPPSVETKLAEFSSAVHPDNSAKQEELNARLKTSVAAISEKFGPEGVSVIERLGPSALDKILTRLEAAPVVTKPQTPAVVATPVEENDVFSELPDEEDTRLAMEPAKKSASLSDVAKPLPDSKEEVTKTLAQATERGVSPSAAAKIRALLAEKSPDLAAEFDAMAAKPQEKATAAPARAEQTLTEPTATKPKGKPTGAPIRITTPDSAQDFEATPEIVELDDLTYASGKFQPRDRSRKESQIGVLDRAAKLDPEQLKPGRVSDAGAPIVTADGMIISGNGRTMSIEQVYRDPKLKDKADAYRASLGDAAKGMRQPIQVSRLQDGVSDAELVEFADRSNRARIASMSATERAQRDAKAIGESVADYKGGDFTAPQNRKFFNQFASSVVTPGERSQFSKDGNLTKEGQDRLSAAVLASAYADADALSLMLESTDDNVRALTNALRDASGGFARLKGMIASGDVKPDMDITGHLVDAVKLISSLRSKGVSASSYFAQLDAFSKPDPIVEEWVRAFYNDDLTRAVSQKRATEILTYYAEEASKQKDGGFIANDTKADDIVALAKRKTEDGPQGKLFAGEKRSGSSLPESRGEASGQKTDTDREAAATDKRGLITNLPAKSEAKAVSPAAPKIRSVEDFTKAVADLKKTVGYQPKARTPRPDIEDAEIIPDDSDAMLALSQWFDNADTLPEKSSMREIATAARSLLADTQAITDVALQHANVKLDGVPREQAEAFESALAELLDIIDDRLQRAYVTVDEIGDIKDKIVKRMIEISKDFRVLARDAENLKSKAFRRVNSIEARLPKQPDESFDDGADVPDSTALSVKQSTDISPYPANFTAIDAYAFELKALQDEFKQAKPKAERFLSAKISEFDPATLDKKRDEFGGAIVRVADAAKMWSEAVSAKIESMSEDIDNLIEDIVTPAIDNLDEARSDANQRYQDLLEDLYGDTAKAADGSAMSALSGFYSPAIRSAELDAQDAKPKMQAVRSMSGEWLVRADEMGGMIDPSMAVTRAGGKADTYHYSDEVTLIAPRDLVDPATAKVFDDDAMSPYLPRAERSYLDPVATDSLKSRIKALLPMGTYGGAASYILNQIDQASSQPVSRIVGGDPIPLQLAYLADNGIVPKGSERQSLTAFAVKHLIDAETRNDELVRGFNAWADETFEAPASDVVSGSATGGKIVPYTAENAKQYMQQHGDYAKADETGVDIAIEGEAKRRVNRLYSFDDMRDASGKIDPSREYPYLEAKAQGVIPLSRYAGAVVSKAALERNPRISEVLKKHGVPFKVADGDVSASVRNFISELNSNRGDTIFALSGFYSPAIRTAESKLSESEARDKAIKAVESGKKFTLEPEAIAAVQFASQKALPAIPPGTDYGSLMKVEPIQGDNKNLTATFIRPDKSTFRLVLSRNGILGSRAMFVPSTNSIVSLRFSGFPGLTPSDQFLKSVRGETYHEVVHALFRSGDLSRGTLSDLISHAESLRILEMPLKQYLTAVGSPSASEIKTKRSVLYAYEEAYWGRDNINDLLKEEAVAHMVELYSHGKLSAEQVAPVKEILDDILSGEISSRDGQIEQRNRDDLRTRLEKLLGKKASKRAVEQRFALNGRTSTSMLGRALDELQDGYTGLEPDARRYLRNHANSMLSRNAGAVGANLQKTRITWQDNFLPVRRLQEAAEGRYETELPDDMRPYLREELYHSRLQTRMEDFEEANIKPFIKEIAASDISIDDLELYLYARHAPERNKQIASINEKMPDGGSGMATADADAIIDGLRKSGKIAEYEKLAKYVERINDGRLKMRVEYGLMTKDEADVLRKSYENYVPLKGDPQHDLDGTPEPVAVPKGFSVTNKDMRRALGRKSRARDIVSRVVQDYLETMVRGERNRVGQSLYELLKAHPMEDVAVIDTPKMKRFLDKRTGLIAKLPASMAPKTADEFKGAVRQQADPLAMLDPNTMSVMVNGERHQIRFLKTELRDAMIAMTPIKAQGLMKAAWGFNRFLSAMTTSFNPSFAFPNFMRDFQAAGVNLLAEGKKKAFTRVFKYSMRSMQTIVAVESGKGKGDWADLYREMKKTGGSTGFYSLKDWESQKDNLQRQIELMQAGKFNVAKNADALKRGFIDVVGGFNNIFENSTRLAAYKIGLEEGLTKEQAASLAKNITVNFNRRGRLDTPASSIVLAAYMFANPSIQGSHRLMKAFKDATPKRRYAILGSMIALGGMMALYNVMIGAMLAEDDEENLYRQRAEYEKANNWMLLNPFAARDGGVNSRDAVAFKIPMPYGYGAIINFGRLAMEHAMSNNTEIFGEPMKGGDTFSQMIAIAHGHFDPLGAHPNLMVSLMPTILKPLAEMQTNTKFTGGPVYPKKFDDTDPDWSLAWRTTPQVYKDFAKAINEWGGGDDYSKGKMLGIETDISPETIKHLVMFPIGGLGHEILRSYALGERSYVTKEPISLDDIPIIRRFVSDEQGFGYGTDFYLIRDTKMKPFEDNRREAARGGGERAKGMLEKREVEAKVYPAYKVAEKRTSIIRKELKDIDQQKKDGKLAPDAWATKQQNLYDKRQLVQMRFLIEYHAERQMKEINDDAAQSVQKKAERIRSINRRREQARTSILKIEQSIDGGILHGTAPNPNFDKIRNLAEKLKQGDGMLAPVGAWLN